MFKFLKDKLKDAVGLFKKGMEEKGEIVEVKEEKIEFKKTKLEIPSIKEEPKIEIKPFKEEPKKRSKIEITEEDKKGVFEKIKEKITSKVINEEQFNELFWELEVALMENNVAFEVIQKIKEDLAKELVGVPIKRGEVEKTIMESLKNSLENILKFKDFDLFKKIKEEKPYVIIFLGVNGSGKTTSIAKIANYLKKNKLTCVLAAADTFRAASIQQLEEHGEKLGIKVIKHDYGSDPAAVAFDAVKYAKQKNIDVVLVDTAGRQHSNANLRDEMKKIVRIANPDLKIYIGEMISGNDCIEQIKEFDKAVNIDGVILSKADIDEKGGTAISVSYVTGKPIFYLGTGQKYNDLEVFNREKILKNLGF